MICRRSFGTPRDSWLEISRQPEAPLSKPSTTANPKRLSPAREGAAQSQRTGPQKNWTRSVKCTLWSSTKESGVSDPDQAGVHTPVLMRALIWVMAPNTGAGDRPLALRYAVRHGFVHTTHTRRPDPKRRGLG